MKTSVKMETPPGAQAHHSAARGLVRTRVKIYLWASCFALAAARIHDAAVGAAGAHQLLVRHVAGGAAG